MDRAGCDFLEDDPSRINRRSTYRMIVFSTSHDKYMFAVEVKNKNKNLASRGK